MAAATNRFDSHSFFYGIKWSIYIYPLRFARPPKTEGQFYYLPLTPPLF